MAELEDLLSYKIDTVIDDGDEAKTLELFLSLWHSRRLITDEDHNTSLIQLRAQMISVENSEAMEIIRDAAALLK